MKTGNSRSRAVNLNYLHLKSLSLDIVAVAEAENSGNFVGDDDLFSLKANC